MLALSLLIAGQAWASELVLLPIKDIQQNKLPNAMQILVTLDFQACKYNYKGIYVEPIANGQGQARYHVSALAQVRVAGSCDEKAEPRTDSALVPLTTERYDFIPMQPR